MISTGRQESIAKRFWQKVAKKDKDECWLWQGKSLTKAGYGLFWPERRTTRTAHSMAFELTYGWRATGDEDTHHICEVKLCCNPKHLMVLSKSEHAEESSKYKQTHCKHGHEYTPENTYIKPNGCRNCRQCIKNRRLSH